VEWSGVAVARRTSQLLALCWHGPLASLTSRSLLESRGQDSFRLFHLARHRFISPKLTSLRCIVCLTRAHLSGGQQHNNWGPTHSYSSEDEVPSYKRTGVFGGTRVVGSLFKTSVIKSHASCATTPSKASSHQSNKTALTSPNTASSAGTGFSNSGERPHVSPKLAMKTGILNRPTPGTPGGGSSNTQHNGTSAATGATSVIANFWKYHASPATTTPRAHAVPGSGGGGGGAGNNGTTTLGIGGGGAADGNTPVPSSSAVSTLPPCPPPANNAAVSTAAPRSSPLSDSARAAAEVVIGMISKAESFLAANAPAGGLCSPRGGSSTPIDNVGSSSSICDCTAMGGVTGEMTPDDGRRGGGGEEKRTNATMGANDNNDTGGPCLEATNCFEGFEKFGFNPFQDGCDGDNVKRGGGPAKNEKNVLLSPSIMRSTLPTAQTPQKPTGYEIRLKSTFDHIRAKRENLVDQANQQAEVPTPHRKQSVQEQDHRPDAAQGGGGTCRTLPGGLPFKEVSVPTEIERSVSELTMRSHGAFELHRYTSDSRRMAYYAVGRAAANMDDNNNNNKSGGNRRCYFTGRPIPYGIPYYAGSVQQGPRTLVVFCLPSALDLKTFDNHHLASKAERERYLESLPNSDANLLGEMSRRYREPFETLPMQVRSPHCWRLFVKFCFFSGLPIAEGEMHYRVKGSVATFTLTPVQMLLQQQGEEIALSHDVVEGECMIRVRTMSTKFES